MGSRTVSNTLTLLCSSASEGRKGDDQQFEATALQGYMQYSDVLFFVIVLIHFPSSQLSTTYKPIHEHITRRMLDTMKARPSQYSRLVPPSETSNVTVPLSTVTSSAISRQRLSHEEQSKFVGPACDDDVHSSRHCNEGI